jgi:hypothetical protein
MQNGNVASSALKILTTTIVVVLPQSPLLLCLWMRGAEGTSLWHHLSQVPPLALIATAWEISYLFACVVAIYRLDDERNLRKWEFYVDAGNSVMSLIIALECTRLQSLLTNQFPAYARFVFWFSVCLIGQFTVTFVARRARDVAKRIQDGMKAKSTKRSTHPARQKALPSTKVRKVNLKALAKPESADAKPGENEHDLVA